jgi:aminopeptidase N
MEPKTIYLKDYRPSPFHIESVQLTVDIFESKTLVTSILKIRRSPSESKVNLELNGENMLLHSVKIDGEVLSTDRYQVSNEKLTLFAAPENFILETVVEIDPASNKALEGFYKSGDQLCTQCEPEGFRKITYFIDRPDVMTKYRTKMIADKGKYPFLLSNGNHLGAGDLPEGRHWIEWEDPHKKPSYLFAMVAGDFDVARDIFITKSGRRVDLEIYVDKGNLHKTAHALESLKTSMKWDEETYGLEYDLDVYMIVAVDSFNMGAMENKGLNIFNSTYTLADQKSATDHDFQNIQGVIGHEYFHNWTGNRVTCRDWFQLTLKEGLTVYRDQEFSSDMLSRPVKRLEDVRMLKDSQFSEDAGPLAHPIRPERYIEINNFYTRTVYEKGAEVIRMIETLIGKDHFRKGMDKYFELFDGLAVTTEDFLHAMEMASGKSLEQFRNWYSRAGTPVLKISSTIKNGEAEVLIEQSYPHTSWKVDDNNVLHMPFRLGFVDGDKQSDYLIELTKMKESFRFKVEGQPILSLNRNFSAPVTIKYDHTMADLLHLMAYDQDAYCRYEATQKVFIEVFHNDFVHFVSTGTHSETLPADFKKALGQLLLDEKMDYSFKSYLLDLPSENSLAQDMATPDFDALHAVHRDLRRKIGKEFKDWFLKIHTKLSEEKPFELTPRAYGERALKNQCLYYLVMSGEASGLEALQRHYHQATNMTEEVHALALYVMAGVELDHPAIQGFYQKWKNDTLVMLKWFSALAAFSDPKVAIARMEKLEKDTLFLREVPNYLRALYLRFAQQNLPAFHAQDGSGYKFLAERIKLIDKFNPQVASRASTAFSMINKLDKNRQFHMKEALKDIMQIKPSRDTYEVISKYLAQ